MWVLWMCCEIRKFCVFVCQKNFTPITFSLHTGMYNDCNKIYWEGVDMYTFAAYSETSETWLSAFRGSDGGWTVIRGLGHLRRVQSHRLEAHQQLARDQQQVTTTVS